MTTYTNEYLKSINNTSNTKELLSTAFNNHPSVITFELCWVRIMGDEPVRELVERIMFFVGGMGSPANNGLKDFIDNYNWKTMNMRKDLFYDSWNGNASSLNVVGNYSCKYNNGEELLFRESGNKEDLMVKLSMVESEIDQTQIQNSIYNLANSFLKLDLHHYHNCWEDKEFNEAVNEFNELNEGEKTIKFASWRHIKKDMDLEYERITLIVKYMIFRMIYRFVYGRKWKENKVDIIQLFNGVYEIWQVRETNFFTIRQVETNIHKAMVKYEISKEVFKWNMITRGERNGYSENSNEAINFRRLVGKLESRCWVLTNLEWINNDTEDNYFRKNATLSQYEGQGNAHFSQNYRGYFNQATKDDVICVIEKYNHNIRDVELHNGLDSQKWREIKYSKSWDKKRLVQAWMSEGETERRHDWKIKFNKIIKLLNQKEIKMSSYKKFRRWVVWNKDGSIYYETFKGRNSMMLTHPVYTHGIDLVFSLRNRTRNKIEYTNDKNYMSEN